MVIVIQRSIFFPECLLYTPFRQEDDIWAKLNGDYIQLESDIRAVKQQVMEFLESTEEARLFVEEAVKLQEVGNELDPQGEQDRYECELDGQVMHPDFEHFNPDFLNLQNEKL